MKNNRIAFIGAGNLTRAIVEGLIIDKFNPKNIWVANPSQPKLDFFATNYGVHTTLDNCQVLDADVVLLAAKSMKIPEICRQIKDSIKANQPLIISVAVGATHALLKKCLGEETAIVRAIPNTPAMVGAGATGLFAAPSVTSEQKNQAEEIFRAVGLTLWVEEEEQLDVLCAVSGCGPGYLFLVMEAIESATANLGLPEKYLRLLIAHTMLGAARLALESNQSLAELRQQVASPNGTTERAIKVLEEGKIRQLLADAIKAVIARTKEMEKILKSEVE